jgi:hypothetical protein
VSGVEYRFFVDGQPASRQLTTAIEQVEVSQLTSAPWEAQLVIPACMNGRGQWDRETEDYVSGRTRFRIEVRARGTWHPLIDGITTGADLAMSGDPGRSSITVRVQDATDELERDRAPRTFGAERAVVDVVRELLQNRTYLEEAQIDTPAARAGERHAPDELTMSGSAYDYLRELASSNGMYIYVLPGTEAGARSRAHFGAMPRPSGDRAPALVLAGLQRNVDHLDFTNNANRPGRIVTRALNIRDRAVETSTITLSNRAEPGAEVAADEEVEHHPSPRHVAAVGPDQAGTAELERLGGVVRGTGVVEGRCYSGVLRPYSYIDVLGVSPRLTGTYRVNTVTHRLTRAGYRQELALVRETLASTSTSASSGGTSASGAHPW